MLTTKQRIERFRKAYPEVKKTDKEILLFLNFHKQLRKEIGLKIQP